MVAEDEDDESILPLWPGSPPNESMVTMVVVVVMLLLVDSSMNISHNEYEPDKAVAGHLGFMMMSQKLLLLFYYSLPCTCNSGSFLFVAFSKASFFASEFHLFGLSKA